MDTASRRPLERADVIRRLQDSLPELKTTHGVRSLALFGSLARGTAKRHSDIDVLVEFEQTPSLLQVITVEQLLSDMLGTRVDLVMDRTLRPEIRQSIARDLIPI